jgi:tetratricopeptide (TPR) repeat protein
LGYAYASAGRTTEARSILNKLIAARQQHLVSPFMIALLYASLNQKDEAFAWLNKACDERDPQIIWFHLDPQLDSLHSDHRFTELIERLGITR